MWALALAGLFVAKYLLDPLLGGWVQGIPLLRGLFSPKTAAALLFLYLPILAMRRRNEYPEDYGATLRGWRRSLKLFATVAAVTFPLYLAGYVGFLWLLPRLPAEVAQALFPYAGPLPAPVFRLPHQPLLHVIDQLFVVALPEEFFYRGYLQSRFKQSLGPGRPFLGISVGWAFVLTQLLFAVGHLVEPYAWRLAVFFPALIFGWLRERSGSLTAGIAYHASCNLLVMVLDASLFGIR